MVGQGLDVTGSVSVGRVGLGQSNLTFRVVDEADVVRVLRRPPLGHLLESAHDVLREARIMAALGETAVPVPQVYGVLQPGVVGDDVPAFMMSWIDGTVVDTMQGATALSKPARAKASHSLVHAMAKVHAVDLDATGLRSLASNGPYAPRQLKRWSAQWERSRTRDLPELDRLTDWLGRHLPTEKELSLVHGDLHVRNVIVDDDTYDVAAVLDWELSTLGHPLADLGTLLAYWPDPGEDGLDDFVPSHLDGFASQAELVDAYALASGRDVDDIAYWHVLGLWKLAIIAEGVLRRTIDEPLNKAADGTPSAERIDGLVDRAARIIDRR
jgi:aminoglycoside phosphotransferase (APT) family kinase protein